MTTALQTCQCSKAFPLLILRRWSRIQIKKTTKNDKKLSEELEADKFDGMYNMYYVRRFGEREYYFA